MGRLNVSSWSCLTMFRGETRGGRTPCPTNMELDASMHFDLLPFVGVSTICSPNIMRYGVKNEILLDPSWQWFQTLQRIHISEGHVCRCSQLGKGPVKIWKKYLPLQTPTSVNIQVENSQQAYIIPFMYKFDQSIRKHVYIVFFKFFFSSCRALLCQYGNPNPQEREKLEEEVLELFSKGGDVQLYPKAVQGKILVERVKREWCLSTNSHVIYFRDVRWFQIFGKFPPWIPKFLNCFSVKSQVAVNFKDFGRDGIFSWISWKI